MKHSYVYLHLYEVNSTLITANTVDEAIAIWREANDEGDVKSVKMPRGDDFILSKIPSEQDIKYSFGE